MKLYVELENKGSQIIQMVGGLDYIIKPGINWLPKPVAEFITTKVEGVAIVSKPVECDEAGVPLEKKSANQELKEPTLDHTVTQEDLDVNKGALEEAGIKVGDEIQIPISTEDQGLKSEEGNNTVTNVVTTLEPTNNLVDQGDKKMTEEEKEKYRTELLDMKNKELEKILDFKEIQHKSDLSKKDLIELILTNV